MPDGERTRLLAAATDLAMSPLRLQGFTMPRSFCKFVLPVLALFLASLLGNVAQAATWLVGSGEGRPGDDVSITLLFRGDGVTSGADITLVLDSARLTIDAPAGELKEASREGRCGWNGSGEVGALIFSGGSEPLPSEDLVVCELKVRIRDNAPATTVVVDANAAHCATADGSEGSCDVEGGVVRIRGIAPVAWPDNPQSTSAVLLLTADAPSVAEILEAGIERSPISAWRELPPHAIRPLLQRVASADEGKKASENPDTAESRLTRYMVADYRSVGERDTAVKLLQRDALIASASSDSIVPFATGAGATTVATKALSGQQHRDDLNIEALWARAGGWGLVGAIDNGLTPDHSELRSFSTGASTTGTWQPGGNYLPYFSANMGLKGQSPTDLTETQPSVAAPSDFWCGTPMIAPVVAGHGTHVAGLIAANGADSTGVSGTCKSCGLAMRKSTSVDCIEDFGPVINNLMSNITAALGAFVDQGVQVVNGSFALKGRYCEASASTDVQAQCDMIAYAQSRDVIFVASTGNNLIQVGFPGTDPRVMAVGGLEGLDEVGALQTWSDSPNCPLPPNSISNTPECGSNFRNGSFPPNSGAGTGYVEVVAQAKTVTSTVVPGWDWRTDLGCGDSLDGNNGDGLGPCTGTSMSAPEVAGMLGVLRSIHPLFPAGTPFTTPTGIRGLMRATGSRTLDGLTNDSRLGYGIPVAWEAAERLLGQVGGETARSRATPLFGLYSSGLDDYAAVATPHLAIALTKLTPSSKAYRSVRIAGDTFVEGFAVPGYTAFPATSAGSPRALAYVLTTEYVRAGLPTTTPLFLMARPRSQASAGDDHLLVNSGLVQTAANAGYALAGRQGYIYPWCTGAGCNPPGTEALHLKCKNASNATTRRCAVFLESQRADFEAKSFTSLFPGAPRSQLGFAYGVSNSDADGLPDAAEYVIGTSPTNPDSDGDGANDQAEYSLTGLPVSDPCQGPNIQCPHILHRIFKDGFE